MNREQAIEAYRRVKALEQTMSSRFNMQPVIDACRSELAMNFECPAERILGFYGAKLGMSSKEMDELLRSLIA